MCMRAHNSPGLSFRVSIFQGQNWALREQVSHSAHPRPHTMVSGELRPVRFPVYTRIGSTDQGKSLGRQPCIHQSTRTGSTSNSSEP